MRRNKVDSFERVKEYLVANRSATVEELQKFLKVSSVRVRKILKELEKEGFLIRREGEAVLAENYSQWRGLLTLKLGIAREEKLTCNNMVSMIGPRLSAKYE